MWPPMFLSLQSQVLSFILEKKADHSKIAMTWARGRRGRRNCPLRGLRLTSVRSGWWQCRTDCQINSFPAPEELPHDTKPGVLLFFFHSGTEGGLTSREGKQNQKLSLCSRLLVPQPESGASLEGNRNAQERWSPGHQPRALQKGKCQSDLAPGDFWAQKLVPGLIPGTSLFKGE